ncbi:MAG: LuxR C-terminal-related transcriptional regulator [Gemmatimonadales bacterium]|jgi:DNA-binding NarL/FixJ family response regulator|nr:LuxR C-terminal-related transcriptional regulator [Gemmatimonadales bacterium]
MGAGAGFPEAKRAAWLEALPCALVVQDLAGERVHANAAGRALLAGLAAGSGASYRVANPLPALGLHAAVGDRAARHRHVATPFGRLRATLRTDAGTLAVLLEPLTTGTGADPPAFGLWPAPLDAGAARLVRLVATGASNAAIAEKLGLSEGTVKSRLHAICRRVGVRGRVDLALLARQLASSAATRTPGARRRAAVHPWGPLQPPHHQALLVLLDHVRHGVAALDRRRTVLWANAAWTRLVGADLDAPRAPPSKGRATRRRRAPTAAGPSGPPARHVAIATWRAGPGLLGGTARPLGAPPPTMVAALRRSGLTRRLAEVACLVAAGHDNQVVARVLGIAPATADTIVSGLYAELGVTSRVEFANRVLDLTA